MSSAGGSRARSFVELFAMCGIAVAQPLFDLLGDNAGLFVARGTSGWQLVALTVAIVAVPPLVLLAVEVVAAAVHARLGRIVHAALLALLAGILAIEVVKANSELAERTLVAVGAAAGVGVALLVARSTIARMFLRFLALAVPVFAVLFLVASPVTAVVFEDDPNPEALAVDVGAPRRVVLVVLDELPTMSLVDGAGEIDAELYPNFARLASESTWYRNATTVSPYTPFAVPAILTGRYPPASDALPDASTYPQSLFSLLAGEYSLNAHEVLSHLCTSASCSSGSSGSSGFPGLVAESARLWRTFASPERAEQSLTEVESDVPPMRVAREFVASLQPSGAAQLDFVHLELPHAPWRYLPTMQDNHWTRGVPGAAFLEWSTQTSASLARARHLLQLGATDVVLGRVLDRLEAIDEYDDALVVVTADHGHAFTVDEPVRAASEGNYPEVMWVPLFVKYPEQGAGAVDDRPAEIVDVMPTIADVLDVDVPWSVDGRSLLGEPRTGDERPLYQWGDYAFDPPDALRPGPGETHLTFDGAAGFEAVLDARAATPGEPSTLRVYRDLELGSLVGRTTESLEVGAPADGEVEMAGAELWETEIDPHATAVPWAYTEGVVRGVETDAMLAFALNGRVVAVARATKLVGTDDSAFFALVVPPELVARGRNRPEMFVVRGTEARPVLAPIAVEGL